MGRKNVIGKRIVCAFCVAVTLLCCSSKCQAMNLEVHDQIVCNDLARDYQVANLSDKKFEEKYNNEIDVRTITVSAEEMPVDAYIIDDKTIKRMPVEIEYKEIVTDDYSKLKTDNFNSVNLMAVKVVSSTGSSSRDSSTMGGTICWNDKTGPNNTLNYVTISRTNCKGKCTYSYGTATNTCKYSGTFREPSKKLIPSEKTTGLIFCVSAGSSTSTGKSFYLNFSTMGDSL